MAMAIVSVSVATASPPALPCAMAAPLPAPPRAPRRRRAPRLVSLGVAAAALALLARGPGGAFVELPALQAAQALGPSRRDALVAVLDAAGLTLSLGEPGSKAPSSEEEKLTQSLYLISRCQEATVQQERFVSRATSQDVLKRRMSQALRSADASYRLVDQIVFASKFIPSKDIVTASQVGNEAVEAFQGAIDYVADDLKKGDLQEDQRVFLMGAMRNTREKLFDFLKYMPADKVQEARRIIEEENVVNIAEAREANIDKDAGVFNPVTLPWKEGFTPL